MGPTLAFQTAHGPAEIALLIGEGEAARVWTDRDEAAGPGQDARLPGLLNGVLERAGISLGAVERIAVVTGPGSFTGLRMGLAFARGLGLALGRPVVGLTLLDACRPIGQQGPVRIAIQAKKRPPEITFWCQDFAAGEAASPPVERALETVATPDWPVETDRPDLFPDAAVGAVSPPSAQVVAARARLYDPEAAPPRPVYVRPPDAALPAGAGR